MGEDEVDFLISYASEQRGFAEILIKTLKDHGCNVFWDMENRDQLIGHLLKNQLPRLFSKPARRFIALISDDYLKKSYPKLELETALKHERAGHGYLLPIIFTDRAMSVLPDDMVFFDGRAFGPSRCASLAVRTLGRELSHVAGQPAAHIVLGDHGSFDYNIFQASLIDFVDWSGTSYQPPIKVRLPDKFKRFFAAYEAELETARQNSVIGEGAIKPVDWVVCRTKWDWAEEGEGSFLLPKVRFLLQWLVDPELGDDLRESLMVMFGTWLEARFHHHMRRISANILVSGSRPPWEEEQKFLWHSLSPSFSESLAFLNHSEFGAPIWVKGDYSVDGYRCQIYLPAACSFLHEHRDSKVFWRLIYPQLLEDTMTSRLKDIAGVIRHAASIQTAHFEIKDRKMILADKARDFEPDSVSESERRKLLAVCKARLGQLVYEMLRSEMRV